MMWFRASITTLVHTDTVEAFVSTLANVSVGGTTGLVLDADSKEELVGVAAAGGFSSGTGVAGSVSVTVLDETTRAFIQNGAIVTASVTTNAGKPNVRLSADDKTTLVAVAGQIAAGGDGAAGVGADAASIIKTTDVFIGSNVTATVAGDILLLSTSVEDLTSVAAGLTASGGNSGTVDLGVHVFDIVTRAFIGDDPADTFPSQGAGNVTADGNVIIDADDRLEIDKVVVAAAVGSSFGGAGALGVSTIDKVVEAFVAQVLMSQLAATVTPTVLRTVVGPRAMWHPTREPRHTSWRCYQAQRPQ